MLRLVVNVEEYPSFISFVSAVRILEHIKSNDETEQFTADVGVKYKFISERFRSIVDVDKQKNTLSIVRAGHGGAVRDLSNNWRFYELKDGSSLIDFRLSVKLKAAPLEYLVRQKFQRATDHLVDVFERRAGQLYPLIGDKEYDFADEKSRLIG